MLMKRNEQGEYLIPKIEMQVIKVELGFASSFEDPTEKPEQDWYIND